MDAKSQLKLIKAGYTIIRPEDQPSPRIKYKSNEQHEWATLEKFESKAARDRRFVQLFDSSQFIISD
jgi:hypothetical protein